MQEAAELQVLHLLRRGKVAEAADFSSQHQLAIGLARALLAQDKGLEALRVVETHRRSMETQGFAQEALKAKVVQVMVHHALGEVGEALQVLNDAVALAAPQGSIRLFVDEGAPMKALLTKLQRQTGMATFSSKLLAAFCAQVSGGSLGTVVTSPRLPPEVFSQRELDILRLIQEGHSNQKISERLFLSLSTVKWHNQNIFAKLDVQRRTEAIARALELKLL